MSVLDRGLFKTQARQDFFDRTVDSLTVLQCTGSLNRNPHTATRQRRSHGLSEQNFRQVPCYGRNPLGFFGILGIIGQYLAVLFYRHAAPARGHHDAFGTGFQQRPPGIDITSHGLMGSVFD